MDRPCTGEDLCLSNSEFRYHQLSHFKRSPFLLTMMNLSDDEEKQKLTPFGIQTPSTIAPGDTRGNPSGLGGNILRPSLMTACR